MTVWYRGVRPRTLSLIVSVLVLAVVAVACSSGGAAQKTPTPTSSEPRIVQERRSDAAGPGYEITKLTNPAARGEVAELAAKVRPNATCSLRVRTPVGTTLKDPGLGEATADDDGNIEWTYTIDEKAFAGTATAYVECPGQTVSAQFRIT